MKQTTAISFNGGKESLVVLHKYMRETKIIFRIDKGDEFREINDYVEYISELYGIKVITFDNMKSGITKLKEEYNVKIVIMGCRRSDPGCTDLKEMQITDSDWPQVMRHNPLLDWSYADVWNYISNNKLPVCSLYEKGYTSIGNKSNTFPNYTLFNADGSYLHAKTLKDESLERIGRIKCSIGEGCFWIGGTVVHGKGMGKGLGFPTANLNSSYALISLSAYDRAIKSNYELDKTHKLDEGVYYGYCYLSLSSEEYKMVMSCGTNPQFGDKSLEVHILKEFDEDFYGAELQVKVVGFIRKMLKFDGIDSLKEAIAKDIRIARFHLDK